MLSNSQNAVVRDLALGRSGPSPSLASRCVGGLRLGVALGLAAAPSLFPDGRVWPGHSIHVQTVSGSARVLEMASDLLREATDGSCGRSCEFNFFSIR